MKYERSRQRSVMSLLLVVGAMVAWLCQPDRLSVALTPAASAGTTFTVNTLGDAGCPLPTQRNCTLRQVIIAANGNPGLDTIRFQISDGPSLVKTITPLSELPAITDPVIIDGTTQPGYAGQPIIELSGGSAGTTASGLTITAGGSTVKGLIINRFGRDGIRLTVNGGNAVQSNYIGTDTRGIADHGNGLSGVVISSSDNVIGGTMAADRNILSGNGLGGVCICGGTDNLILRNYIGTNAAGTAALGNSTGVIIQTSSENTIGGALGMGNVISGNVNSGIGINIDGSSNKVQGNFIGTDWSGNTPLPNDIGIRTTSIGNVIGGTNTWERNVISGNASFGVLIADAAAIYVHGNIIGMSASGGALGNNSSGVAIVDAVNNNIQNNTIAFNGSDGITVSSGTGNLLLTNRTFSNSGLGIDLGPDGVTANDTGDGDTGANNQQNFPILTSAVLSAGTVTVQGTLNSTPNTLFTIQLYSTDDCASGRGQGSHTYGFVSGVATNATGNLSFTFQGNPLPAGRFLLATAVKLVTGVGSETSEFSPCRQMVAPGTLEFSASGYSASENASIASVTINRVGGSDGSAQVLFSISNGTATAGLDYTSASGPVNFADGQTSRTVSVPIIDDASVESSETVNLTLTHITGSVPISTPSTAVLTISDNDSPTSSAIHLSSTTYSGGEDCTTVLITVQRVGDTSGVSTIDYATTSGTASDRTDFTAALGTLRFNAGETQKSFSILINEDSLSEGLESFSTTLSNPTNAIISSPSVATVSIIDDSSEPSTNASDDSAMYVCQHYHDFLNRQPDTSGQQFWINEIESCGGNLQCRESKRVNVSAAFFLSIEFQQTGYLVYRMYKTAHGNLPGVPVPLTLPQFLPDTQAISRGVQVGIGDWEAQLEANKQLFASEFVTRPRFTSDFPSGMPAAQFVDKLNTNSGGALSPSERDQLVNDLSSGVKTRAQVLRAVAEDQTLAQTEFNRAFVLMQYFGYLRRNPNSIPDSDFSGYNFWLGKLNAFGGNFADAEMVKAFIVSGEYRQRFGP